MSSKLARAMLKEIPLAHIEVYLQVLESGVLKGRSAADDDHGTICGAGCDSKGGACGAWCEAPEHIPWGCFDQQGQADISKDEFHNIIADPTSFRKTLTEELMRTTRAIEAGGAPTLGPKVVPELYVNRG